MQEGLQGVCGVKEAAGGPHEQPPAQSPLPPLQCLEWGLQAGDHRMGSKKPGKSITLACSACSCNLPITGTVPCLPLTAQGPGGDMQLIPGPGQHRGCLLGMERTTGPTALQDFGTRFLPQLLGTQLWCWECICRNPLVSARLHEGEGRVTLSSSPNALPLASPGSHSHTSRPLHDILGLGKQPAGASALTLFKPGSCRTKKGE